MAELFSDLPGWMKTALAVIAFSGGASGLQYFGLSAPAKESAATAQAAGNWCEKRLDEVTAQRDALQVKLLECWEGRSR